jgi:hypothetical protein
MTKAKVLAELERVVEGRTAKSSEIVREFRTCPQFQQCSRILAQALQYGGYSRKRSATKVPPGLVPPG